MMSTYRVTFTDDTDFVSRHVESSEFVDTNVYDITTSDPASLERDLDADPNVVSFNRLTCPNCGANEWQVGGLECNQCGFIA